jgi:UDPglucose--hexose-1-phosphate uridylyltransferase
MIGNGITELRKDPTTNRWVLVQKEPLSSHGDGPCPFCPGQESCTPLEIAAFRSNGQPPNSSEWLVRVVPERAPFFQVEGDIQREGLGIFDRVSSRGASEILIEHPNHQASWETMAVADIERILWMYRQRIEDLYRDRQIRSVLVYRCERSASSRVQHPFSRILGAPIVFDDLREELKAARDHYARKQRCLYCDILNQEIQEGARVIARTTAFVVYAPYGSRRRYETWIVPSTHGHRFELGSPSEMTDLGRLLQTMTRSLHAVKPNHPIEMAIHTAPNGAMRLRGDDWRSLSEDYHWHIELAPIPDFADRIGGFHVNTVAPETAARHLRATL